MRPNIKVLFFGVVIFLAAFLPPLAGSTDFESSEQEQRRESRNLSTERRFEPAQKHSGMKIPVYNSNGLALSPQEQEAILSVIKDDFWVNDDTVGPSDQYYPAIAKAPTGDFVITWYGNRDGNWNIYAQRYNSSGTPQDTNFKVNDHAGTAYQGVPALAMDGSGNFVITWDDLRNGNPDIYAQRFNSSGTPQDTNFKVNDDAGTADQYDPAIAMDSSGNFVITWDDFRNGYYSDIYAQRYNSSGTPQGVNSKVNDDAGTADQYDPAIAADGSGNFVITWMDYRNGNGNWDIYAQRYNSSGTPQGANFKVNDDAGTARQYDPAIAMDGSGNFVITWYDLRNGNWNIYAQRYDSSGTLQGANFKVNDDAGTAEQSDPAIAMDGSGNFVITWEDLRNGNLDIYAQRYNSPGTPQGANFKVNDDTATAEQSYPAIAMDGSGNFVITWYDFRNGGYSDIYAQRYDSSGTPQGANFKVNNHARNAQQDIPAIAMDGSGNFVITWCDYRNGNRDIYAQRYNSSGTPQGANFKVNDDAGTARQHDPAIAMDGSGNFVITWEDLRNGNLDIYAQRYNSPGTPQGANFKVNDDTATAEQSYPAIAMDGSGNFVITWHNLRNGYYSDIYAQRYDSSGTPQGANFKVNNDTGTAYQYDPAIAMDGSGNFVITWQHGHNGSYYDIHAQRYNSSGTPQGANSKVNDDAGTAWEGTPAIAMDGSGNFVITWCDYRNGNRDIYAQRYNSSGTPTSSNYLVPNANYSSFEQAYPAVGVNSSDICFTWEDDRRDPRRDIYAKIVDWDWSNYICGDANGDGVVNSADVAYLINYLFVGGPAPVPLAAGDANLDGNINSADVAYLINYLFVGGPAPCK